MSLAGRLLGDPSLHARTEPTMPAQALKLELAKITRDSRGKTRFHNILWHSADKIHEMKDHLPDEGRIEAIDPKEILLMHELWEGSLERLREIKRKRFRTFLTSHPVDVGHYSFVGDSSGLYIITTGPNGGGNHRSFLSSGYGLPEIPAIVGFVTPTIGERGFVMAYTVKMREFMEGLLDQPQKFGGFLPTLWAVNENQVRFVSFLEESIEQRDLVADLLLHRGSPIVMVEQL